MRKLKIVFLSFCFLMSFINLAYAQSQGNYLIDFSFPADMHWNLVSNKQDAGGYFISYESSEYSNDQNLKLNFGLNITTSLLDSMQEVVNVSSLAHCQKNEAKIIQKKKNTLIWALIAKVL